MITVSHLTKRYGAHTAVDDVSFTVRPGRVCGFLGPNGAGKSTTMRMIVGLTIPTAGSSTVLDLPYARLGNPGTRVGVLLDASAQHAGRTGREVLTLGAMTMGLPTTRVNDMIERVGLTAKEAGRRVGDYSLGMRQRLGIAHALLGDPEALILDEPANGLDPAGIRWMRDLLRDFAGSGGTVLLSSHLLSEVEAIADDLVVISNGAIVAEGGKDELLAASGCVVRTADDERFIALARQTGIDATRREDGALLMQCDPDAAGALAFDHAIRLRELRAADGGGLEDLFLQLTAGADRDRSAETTTREAA